MRTFFSVLHLPDLPLHGHRGLRTLLGLGPGHRPQHGLEHRLDIPGKVNSSFNSSPVPIASFTQVEGWCDCCSGVGRRSLLRKIGNISIWQPSIEGHRRFVAWISLLICSYQTWPWTIITLFWFKLTPNFPGLRLLSKNALFIILVFSIQ